MKYTKEELLKQNEILKDVNAKLEEANQKLNKDLNSYIELTEINIDLQVKLKHQEKENSYLQERLNILSSKVETFEEVFQLLKKVEK